VDGDRTRELLLAAGQLVQRRLRAPQPGGQVIECEPREALGQEQRDEVVEQLLAPGGRRRTRR
jgi:hypothetical protein